MISHAGAGSGVLGRIGEPAAMGVFELDLPSLRLTACAQFKTQFGLDPAKPANWRDLGLALAAPDRECHHAAFEAALATGAAYDLVHRVIRADGQPRWLHLRGRLIRDEDGRALRLAGASLDITEHRETALHSAFREASWQLTAEAAELGTWDLDLTTEVLTWSDRTKAMFGISADVACSMADFYNGLHPEDRAATEAAFASAIDPQIRAVYDVEYRTVGREDGRIRWVAAKGRGLFADGVCYRAIGTAIDITARKRAATRQTFLLGLLDRLRHLTDPDAISQTAVAALGQYLGANRVGYGQVQRDDATVVLETCHAEGVARLTGAVPLDSFGTAHIDRQRRGQTVWIDDVQLDPASDRAVWAGIETRAWASVPLLRDGRFRASLFVNFRSPHAWDSEEIDLIEDVAGRIWDALERARAEAALRQLNISLEKQVQRRTEALDRTWRLCPVLMVVGDEHARLLAVNPAWTRQLGWTAEQTIGRDVMDFVAPEDRESAAAGMARLSAGQPVIDHQLGLLSSDGQIRRIAWTTVPDGRRLYGFGRDITDQLQAEERLRQAQKMEAVGRLTGGLAHDFNNLLAGITGSLELLQLRTAQGRLEDTERYIAGAYGAARRGAILTQRLLAFSRQQALAPKPTDINRLVADMEELIRRTVGPGLDVVVAPAPALGLTLVDPHQLESALLNLCINARDAMPDGGRLSIVTAEMALAGSDAAALELPAGFYVTLAVADTGTGMTPEVMRRAFDPFFTTKPIGAGTGLGLSMIYGFARQSGGQVRIRSLLGEGSTVTIYLPLHAGRMDPEAKAGGDASKEDKMVDRIGHGETVLVVDDEAMVRVLITEVLDELGYQWIEAEDGAAGLSVLQSGRQVDLLITDVGLPGGMNGRQLADAGRALRPELRVLFVTGYAENALVGQAQLERDMQVLAKPFSLDVLSARIRELIPA